MGGAILSITYNFVVFQLIGTIFKIILKPERNSQIMVLRSIDTNCVTTVADLTTDQIGLQ